MNADLELIVSVLSSFASTLTVVEVLHKLLGSERMWREVGEKGSIEDLSRSQMVETCFVKQKNTDAGCLLF